MEPQLSYTDMGVERSGTFVKIVYQDKHNGLIATEDEQQCVSW